jgi:hypothetical protein
MTDPGISPERPDSFLNNLGLGGDPVVSGPEAKAFKNQEGPEGQSDMRALRPGLPARVSLDGSSRSSNRVGPSASIAVGINWVATKKSMKSSAVTFDLFTANKENQIEKIGKDNSHQLRKSN